MKVSRTPEDLEVLQQLIDRSTRTAGPAVADSVGAAPRQMTAAQLADYWESAKLVAMATVGPSGNPHIAPVHARLLGNRLTLVVYENTLRREDIRTNNRTAFTAWAAQGGAVILYGKAREVPDSLRPARDSAQGNARMVVEIEVHLTRVYALRPPDGPGSTDPETLSDSGE